MNYLHVFPVGYLYNSSDHGHLGIYRHPAWEYELAI